MKIKKLSHCCLIIETQNKRLMTDPGLYSLEQHSKAHNLDMILITHEHADHVHIASLKQFVKAMPKVKVITNDAVGEMLAREGIEHHVMKDGNVIDHDGIHLEAIGHDHAIIHKSLPVVSNIGYFIDHKLFYPGDALTLPGKKVDVLALPVAGPWIKISEAIDYALAIKPRLAFPVHDAVRSQAAHKIPSLILPQNGIDFVTLEEGQEINL